MTAGVLPVADTSRAATRRAVLLVLLCAGLFTAFAVLSTQDSALRAHSPWQDDPFDAVVSFTMAFVPLACALLLLRVPLCRRALPLPAARLLAIQRAADVVLAGVTVTLGVDWVAVALGTDRSAWASSTALLIGALAVITLVAALALATQWQARRSLARHAPALDPTGPDWLDDAITLVALAGSRVSPIATQRVVGLARSIVDGRHGLRRHRLVAAVMAALAFGVAVAGSHQVAEGGGPSLLDAVGVFLLFTWIGAAGMLAFLLAAGWYLRLVRPLDAGAGQSAWPRDLALVAAMAAVPLAVAFREPLWSFLPGDLPSQPAGGLLVLSLGASVLAGAVVFGAASAARRTRRGRRSSR